MKDLLGTANLSIYCAHRTRKKKKNCKGIKQVLIICFQNNTITLIVLAVKADDQNGSNRLFWQSVLTNWVLALGDCHSDSGKTDLVGRFPSQPNGQTDHSGTAGQELSNNLGQSSPEVTKCLLRSKRMYQCNLADS